MSNRYEKEFKLNAVKLVAEHKKSAAQVSRELGVIQDAVWMDR